MTSIVRIAAPAKVNLSLEILGRRPDGYHEILSVMQTVSLADELTLEGSDGVRVRVAGAELPEDNLVVRAASRLRDGFRVPAGCSITLEKRIPVAAGLGGGSSDAAATLLGLCRLWGIDIRIDRLAELAAELGSDVPFFLHGGICMAEGRGERVTPLQAPRPSWYVLANPGVPVLAAAVYGALRPEEWSDGSVTRSLAARLDGARRAPLGCNALQAAVFRLSPHAVACYRALSALAPDGAMVSGSGPTAFASFADEGEANGARDSLRAEGYWAETVRSTPSIGEGMRCA
jgi:4-diphosphocytidyl-2-C-methyl-D-erythritol kinase